MPPKKKPRINPVRIAPGKRQAAPRGLQLAAVSGDSCWFYGGPTTSANLANCYTLVTYLLYLPFQRPCSASAGIASKIKVELASTFTIKNRSVHKCFYEPF